MPDKVISVPKHIIKINKPAPQTAHAKFSRAFGQSFGHFSSAFPR